MVHLIGKSPAEGRCETWTMLVVPVCFPAFNDATVLHRWAFSPFISLYFFAFSVDLLYQFYRSSTFE